MLLIAKFSFGQLLISGVYDGTLTGGQPKGIELFATDDIPDLSIYAIESINSPMDGSTGPEFTFPADALSAGSTIFLTGDMTAFMSFFNTSADYEDSGSMSINGDDPVALYKDGVIIDVFGVIGTDGSGEAWEYLDGWASRNPGTSASTSFNIGDWTFSGVDGLEGGDDNATATNPYPLARYGGGLPPDVAVEVRSNVYDPADITINVGETVEWTNVQGRHNVNGSLAAYPNNPEGLDNGPAALPPWTFRHTFTIPGLYNYQCDPHVGFGMLGTVTVVGETIEYPAYDIPTVTSNDENGVPDSIDVTCTLVGTVHGVNLRDGGLLFALIDTDNNGITVFSNSEDFGYTVNQGDLVSVEGQIGQFNGLTQLNVDGIMMTGAGTVVSPKSVTDLVEEDESSHLRLEGVVVDSLGPEGGSGRSVFGTISGNNVVIRINSATDVPLDAFEVGNTYNVNGIGGQFDRNSPFDEGYQLVPQRAGDVDLVTSVEVVNLSDDISVSPSITSDIVRVVSRVDIDRIEVVSLNGQRVQDVMNPARSSVIDLIDRTSGTYVLRFTTPEGQWSTRIVKQ